MGKDFEDNWTTPKHIRIERAGEPKGIRRGSTDRNRRKGPKARMDEIISARNDVKRCYEWIQEERDYGMMMRETYVKWHARAVQKLLKLLKSALEDGIITEKGAEHVRGDICVL